VKAADNELLARQAGASTVINPVSFAGLLLAGSCEGAKISDYLSDLASATGRVNLIQRDVTDVVVGLAMNDIVKDGLGVRIYRGNTVIGFWEAESKSLESGDIIVEIIPGNGESKTDAKADA
jgi:voltage-gated potassium channel